MHATRLLLEKHREKRRPVHLAFLDMEKAFDRVPRDVIWYALRQHGVPEELIEINSTKLARTTTFKYLGSAIASDGSLIFETNSRVNAVWLKWCSMTGVLCDKNMHERPKSKIYGTVIRLQFTALIAGLQPKKLKPVP
uniref:Reverse transcriptase domain-containing protein n=1 Tax=Haemonchus contortus TaxID=6289 RepID=A0A7I5E579_HAECO